MSAPLITFLVLDYLKPQETRLCLESILAHAKVPHKTVLLDNGGAQDYSWAFYKAGLCDTLISKRLSEGGGVGQTDLFRWCDTPYALFVQSDQVMVEDLAEDVFSRFRAILDVCQCIDLNGDQSNRMVWTDRAHLVKTDFFNSLAPFPNGGPGPRHGDRWNENYLQEVFEKNGYQIAHMKPMWFRDNGVWTVRDNGGGKLRLRTDTKELTWLKAPTHPDVFPDHAPEEWTTAIAGNWVAGTTPVNYITKGQVFNCWGNQS